MTRPFRVVARYGNEVDVLQRPGGIRLRANLRRRTDDVVCGDRVLLEFDPPVVTSRTPRENQLTRRDLFNRRKTIAANIDRVWVVVAPRPETPKWLIDRFLVAIFNLPAEPGLLLNKQDLDAGDTLAVLKAAYGHLRMPILAVGARAGIGLESLRAMASGRSNILVGPSGVGKSSLIQALLPEESLRIAPLGETGEGRHTTTTARWYETGDGAAWVDSPGVRDFSPEIAGSADLVRGFPDISEYAHDCRFRDCSHHREPGCALRAAVNAGRLPAARLEAWLSMLAAAGAIQER